MLRTALQSHPEVYFQSEVYLYSTMPRHYDLIPDCPRALFSREPERAAVRCFLLGKDRVASGLTIFYEQMRKPHQVGLWPFFGGFSGLHIIHLQRRNPFFQWLSLEEAMISNHWFVPRDKAYTPAPPIALKSYRYCDWLKRLDAEKKSVMKQLGHHPRLDVYYEDLVDRFPQTIKSILSFLGVSEISLDAYSKKLATRPIAERVTNLEEFVREMRGKNGEAAILEALEADASTVTRDHSGSMASISGS